MTNEMIVFMAGRRAGVARRRTELNYRSVAFRYDNDYIADPDSVALSVRWPVIGGDEHEIGLWLDGLLPDSPNVRRDWAQRSGATALDAMSMLGTEIGLDCAGATQFCPLGEEEVVTGRGSEMEWHSEDEIAKWIRDAKQGLRSQLGSQVRYSLGGWQTKIALYREGGRWGTPYGQQPTTWILKPGIDPRDEQPFSDSDLVEHVTMTAANLLDLEVAHTCLERFGDERVLAVERYDRSEGSLGWERIHQEDLCQALDRASQLKYQNLGGPSPAEIADLLSDESIEADADIERFVDALIFNWATASIDGHAKNYSLLLERGRTQLAPFYDIMSFLPYRQSQPIPDIAVAMAVEAGYKLRDGDHFTAWERVGEKLGLDPKETAGRAEDILRRCPEAFTEVIDSLDPADRRSPQIAALARDLQQRHNDAIAVFRHSVPAADTPTYNAVDALLQSIPSSDTDTHRSVDALLPAPSGGAETARSQKPMNEAVSAVNCSAPTGIGKSCRRQLVWSVCPDHPNSSGSLRVKSRNKHSS